jgi:hypothetical protein
MSSVFKFSPVRCPSQGDGGQECLSFGVICPVCFPSQGDCASGQCLSLSSGVNWPVRLPSQGDCASVLAGRGGEGERGESRQELAGGVSSAGGVGLGLRATRARSLEAVFRGRFSRRIASFERGNAGHFFLAFLGVFWGTLRCGRLN